ncbi:MAG: hypothetical protein KatS3mg085_413 [Candidatus Dojkabacteria bacterium]|nr:MAG: hypothetical protein KatS3mg085_413 [Candidatus Dojkabacteria bacterium]
MNNPEITFNPSSSSDEAWQSDLLNRVRKMNLVEQEELRKLGFEVDKEGNLIVPLPRKRNVLDKLKEIAYSRIKSIGENFFPEEVDQGRRTVLKVMAATTAAVILPVEANDSTELPDSPETPRSVRDNVENQEEIIIKSAFERMESGEDLATIVLADEIALYPNAPNPANRDNVTVPETNEQLFEPGEQKGFVDKPYFLVIHTTGFDPESARAHNIVGYLMRNRIMTQFVVGKVGNTGNEVKSIQCVPLLKDAVNINGTTSGSINNPVEASLQLWGSLNVEVAGLPDKVNDEIFKKTIELCINSMTFYNLKISQIIGHNEVPNNGKVDPGTDVMKKIRTEIYLRLLKKKMFHLIDIFEEADVDQYFVEESNGVTFRNGRVMCWKRGEFCNWSEIEEFLKTNPAIATQFERYKEGKIKLEIVEKITESLLDECYLGLPPFEEWVYLPYKPLADQKYIDYQYRTLTAQLIKIVYEWLSGKPLEGSRLPFSYETTRLIADILQEKEVFTSQNVDDNNLSSISRANSTQRPTDQHIQGLKSLRESYKNKIGNGVDPFIQALDNFLNSNNRNN